MSCGGMRHLFENVLRDDSGSSECSGAFDDILEKDAIDIIRNPLKSDEPIGGALPSQGGCGFAFLGNPSGDRGVKVFEFCPDRSKSALNGIGAFHGSLGPDGARDADGSIRLGRGLGGEGALRLEFRGAGHDGFGSHLVHAFGESGDIMRDFLGENTSGVSLACQPQGSRLLTGDGADFFEGVEGGKHLPDV